MPTRSRPPLLDTASRSAHEAQPRELRTFGRRRGRSLSARQHALLDETLPALALNLTEAGPQSLPKLFPLPVSEVWLEIGFGGAEHLIWQASTHPGVGLIGCEVFEDGIVKALAAVKERSLNNVRLCTEDARALLRWLPPGGLARVFVLFPDPWPKKRHAKRRLVTREFLDLLARVIGPGGELRVASDIGDYARLMLLAAQDHPAFVWQAQGPRDWRARGPDWPQTRYEAKALSAGRRCYFFHFTRTECH